MEQQKPTKWILETLKSLDEVNFGSGVAVVAEYLNEFQHLNPDLKYPSFNKREDEKF